MPASEPRIQANMLAGLESLLSSKYALNLPQLLNECGIDPNLQPDAAVAIPLNSFSRLLELAAMRSGDECFGLGFAHAFPRGGMHVLGFLILNAPDLRTCLECLARYVHLQCDGVDFHSAIDDGVARFAIECGPAFVAPRKQFLEFVMSLTVVRLANEFGDGWVPLRADFEYREPGCAGDYEILFGRHLNFDAPQTALWLRSEVLKSRSEDADETLFAMLKGVVEREIASLEHENKQGVVWAVDEYIVSSLAIRAVSLENAASNLKLTARQLQLELKKQNTTFEDEVGRVRRSLAERYMRDSNMPLTEIALLLGFSELSAFTRAARLWFGMPPSQWRQQQRLPASARDP